jgi:hypothetical protein
MIDPTDSAVNFVKIVATAVYEAKPEATRHEVIGIVYQILNKTIETLLNEQLPESGEVTSPEGIGTEPEQVQGNGDAGGLEESAQGVLSEQGSLTKGGRKKRRSKKS